MSDHVNALALVGSFTLASMVVLLYTVYMLGKRQGYKEGFDDGMQKGLDHDGEVL